MAPASPQARYVLEPVFAGDYRPDYDYDCYDDDARRPRSSTGARSHRSFASEKGKHRVAMGRAGEPPPQPRQQPPASRAWGPGVHTSQAEFAKLKRGHATDICESPRRGSSSPSPQAAQPPPPPPPASKRLLSCGPLSATPDRKTGRRHLARRSSSSDNPLAPQAPNLPLRTGRRTRRSLPPASLAPRSQRAHSRPACAPVTSQEQYAKEKQSHSIACDSPVRRRASEYAAGGDSSDGGGDGRALGLKGLWESEPRAEVLSRQIELHWPAGLPQAAVARLQGAWYSPVEPPVFYRVEGAAVTVNGEPSPHAISAAPTGISFADVFLEGVGNHRARWSDGDTWLRWEGPDPRFPPHARNKSGARPPAQRGRRRSSSPPDTKTRVSFRGRRGNLDSPPHRPLPAWPDPPQQNFFPASPGAGPGSSKPAPAATAARANPGGSPGTPPSHRPCRCAAPDAPFCPETGAPHRFGGTGSGGDPRAIRTPSSQKHLPLPPEAQLGRPPAEYSEGEEEEEEEEATGPPSPRSGQGSHRQRHPTHSPGFGKQQQQQQPEALCPQGHCLVFQEDDLGDIQCSVCELILPARRFAGCRACDYDVCDACLGGLAGPASVTVVRNPDEGTGAICGPSMLLEEVVRGSPAHFCGMARLVGRRLTHINNIPVATITEACQVAQDAASVTMRFV